MRDAVPDLLRRHKLPAELSPVLKLSMECYDDADKLVR